MLSDFHDGEGEGLDALGRTPGSKRNVPMVILSGVRASKKRRIVSACSSRQASTETMGSKRIRMGKLLAWTLTAALSLASNVGAPSLKLMWPSSGSGILT